MKSWGVIIPLLLVSAIMISAGCIANPFAANQSGKNSLKSVTTLVETPTLPDQYVAQARFGGTNPVHITPSPAQTKGLPILSGSRTNETGTGLTGGSTANATIQQIVQFLNTTNTDNQTANLAEQQFWNQVASNILLKIDGGNPVTRDFALTHINPVHSGTYNVQQVADIWDYVEPNWTYVNDPLDPLGQFWDYFSSASETITIGLKGDCDDFAILNAATVEAIGGNSRVVYAANAGGAHMYAEAQFDPSINVTPVIQSRYGLSPSTPVYTHPGNWLNLDWFDYPKAATHPGGNFYADGGMIWVIYNDGHWEKLQQSGSTWNIILSGP